ncbi:TetR family transcriptional regulator [Actinorhabdospora filicis]|uniref:TetR family transcriptional regulator n=1 Tax=Actinorhabdospora filicis TaxID=1785913 RepID=A0A9W6W378_9ACTN|nr:TetR/AcrR family transcriptional regulator [Actinorhabdospora filicis]GLZ77842.1 TetR family transcriptional regulator [Actinorhabdospora filicis]
MQVTAAAKARRDEIIAATLTVLARDGYAGTSFKRIVDEAGLSSTRLISYHFDGKEELLLAVLRTVAERGAEAMRAAMAIEHTMAGRLAAYIRANLEFLGGDPVYAPALAEIIHNLRAWRSEPGGDADIAVEQLAGLLRVGQTTREFGDFDPVVMAVAIRASIDAVALRLAARPGLDLAHHIDELLAIYRAATERSSS